MASVRLLKSLENNSSLNDNYYLQLLSYVEKIIQLVPREYQNNFYENIKTLKIKGDIKNIIATARNSNLTKFIGFTANYNTKDNVINLDEDAIIVLYKKSLKTGNPDNYFWQNFNETMLHELFHMASSKYDVLKDISKCGLDNYNNHDLALKSYRGLTEGITESLAIEAIPQVDIASNGYYIEALLVEQLSMIIGSEIILSSYFGNLGLDEIKKELLCTCHNESMVNHLFVNIEDNFQGRNGVMASTGLASAQITLINIFFAKLKKETQLTDEEINVEISKYEKILITREIINKLHKNINKYFGLDDSIQYFYEQKNSLLNKIKK